MTTENEIEKRFIKKLTDLKYTYREDIRDKASLEQNFREKFESLNRVNLTDAEFARLRDEIISPDVFKAAATLRERNTFQREDGIQRFWQHLRAEFQRQVVQARDLSADKNLILASLHRVVVLQVQLVHRYGHVGGIGVQP